MHLKSFFKDWNLKEIIVLITSIIVISIVGIIFKSDFITLATALTAVTTTMLLAKGEPYANIIYIICILVYLVLCYRNKYYGEIIIYIFLILPMCISGLISWIKHTNKKTNTVEINKISKKEITIISILIFPIIIGTYYLLRCFNTNELYASTFTFICTILANYFQIRRSKYNLYFFFIEDISLLLLWILPIIKGNISLLPIVINSTFNMVNEIYGIYNWKVLETKQKTNI